MLIALLAFPASADVVPFEDHDSIEVIREKIRLNGFDFEVDENWVFRLSEAEKSRLFSRRASDPGRSRREEPAGPLEVRSSESLPSAFDWRNVNGRSYVNPVRDQGSCGACYAFGAVAAAETTYNFAMNFHDAQRVNFSESWIAWCIPRHYPGYSQHFSGCEGADYDYQELEALVQVGVTYEANRPYTTYDPGPCETNVPLVKFDSWHRAGVNDLDAIKSAIMTYGAVDAAVKVTSAFQSYRSGIYQDTATTCPDGAYTITDHAIALVGWNDNHGDGYWILRNSWGSSWGENGYMRISYQAARVACAATYLVYAAGAPGVATLDAIGLTATGATVRGSVNPNGMESWYWFEYGTNTSYGARTASVSAGSGSGALGVSAVLTELASDTLYHFRVAASNASGRNAFGEDSMFATLGGPEPPHVTTLDAAAVGLTNATLRGSVNPNGTPATAWFQYGTNVAALTNSTAKQPAGSGSLAISVSNRVGGLRAGMTWYYRVAASNEHGLSQGTTLSLVTSNAVVPTVTTAAVSKITAQSAQFAARINPQGSPARGWFEYGQAPDPDLLQKTAAADIAPSFLEQPLAESVPALQPQMRYYVRTAASNQTGIARSDFVLFETLPDSDVIFLEDFEHNGNIPAGFSLGGYFNWEITRGSPYLSGLPDAAYGGEYNISLGGDSDDASQYGDLVTPAIQFGANTNNPVLSFWLAQARWQYFQDILHVHARSAAGAPWVHLATFSNDIPAWTKITLELPDPSDDYSIRFRATPHLGDGVCIDDILITASPAPPTPPVSTLDAISITATSAVLRGLVNPFGAETRCRFEYGTSLLYGITSPWQNAGSGTTDLTMQQAVGPLQPSTRIYFRMVATNQGGISHGESRTFQTAGEEAAPPQVIALPASQIGATTASLSGTVIPNSALTRYRFEYGANSTFAERTGWTTLPSSVSTASVGAVAAALEPGTLYRYRLVASNDYGQAVSATQTFTTAHQPASDLPWHVHFTNALHLPPGWSNVYLSSQQIPWRPAIGDFNEDRDPAGAAPGPYNALVFYEGYDAQQTRLVSPPINIGTTNDRPVLRFNHLMRAWEYDFGGGDVTVDIDQLRVYGRPGSTNDWILLATFTNAVEQWTPRTVPLPDPGPDYAIAFEATLLYGYGVAIDNIRIMGAPAGRTPTPVPALILLLDQ